MAKVALGAGAPRQPRKNWGTSNRNVRLNLAAGYGILCAMKGITLAKTHHASGAHMRFLVALALAVAASALLAAPSDPYVCYKPDSGKSIYPWNHAAKWFDSTGSVPTLNRVPTTNDYVFLYSSKNDVSSSGKPMVVTNGVHAETGVLEICDKSNGQSFLIGVTVQDGGTMTNAGVVYVGNSGNGKTGGGLLTVESGGVWAANSVFMLGCSSGTSWLNVKPGGSFSCAGEFRVGHQYGSGIVTNEGMMSVYDVFPGVSGTGILVNKGDLTVERKLTIGRYSGSTGHVILESGSRIEKRGSSYPVYIAFANKSTGILECRSDLKFANATSISVANGTNSTGRLVIGEGGVVSNASSVAIGAPPLSCGSVELHGGSLWVKGDNNGHRVRLGSDGETTTGRISGWGSVRRVDSTLRILFFGQVIADGEGTMHDLNMASFRTVGTNDMEVLPNACGTNGWFAVNKGRLIYPRAQNCSGASHPTIGDYPNRASATVMNSFRYTLDKPRPEGTYYNFAELYAPDREDIPRGLPVGGRDVVAGGWRFGLSSASGPDINPVPISFTGMSLTFRYDWREMREGQTVVVYRHDGTANGTWTRVSRRMEMSSTENTITTEKFDPSSATWNAGWFAVVAQNYGSTTVIFR